MTDLVWLGQISLNISFVLYLIVYVPQIIHNHTSNQIADLSLGLHFLLFLSYIFDLMYGFSYSLPWQYKTVSTVGLGLVIIQHLQLTKFFLMQKYTIWFNATTLFLFINLVFLYYFFVMAGTKLDLTTTLIFGTVARTCGLIYCIPQIIKNAYAKTAAGISLYFIYLNLLLAILDTISSWTLNWGWPNKLAAPANIVIMLIILWQTKIYRIPANLFQKTRDC